MSKEIYVNVIHADFWWGVYGLKEITDWEDVVIYEKDEDSFNKIASTCICSRKYLGGVLKDIEEDLDEKVFVEEVKSFLENKHIYYKYFYRDPNSEGFHEVSFEAMRNENNVKPSYIEIWHPGMGIDFKVIEECVTAFCKKFLDLKVEKVLFKDIIPIEEAKNEYIKYGKIFNNGVELIFSEELVEQIMKELNMTREEALKMLNKI
ncbi:MAG: hypothetical protein ACOY46_08780 [Bacillota bacterium]